MIRRISFALAASLLGAVVVNYAAQSTQTPVTEVPRGIRRDVPMTNIIRRAWDAGTRDASGRPGPKYWQLQTDYTINVSLDPATATLTGTETIVLHNNSPQDLAQLRLRL